MTATTPAILILAAGASSRMGTPKAALRLSDRPLLEHHIQSSLALFLSPIVVVLGCRASELRQSLQLEPAHVVVNEGWEAGQFSSVQAGLKALSLELSTSDALPPVFLTPVDCPPVPGSVFHRLWTHLSGHPRLAAVVPACGGQPGHPVLLGPAAIRAALAAPPGASLDRVLKTLGDACVQLEVDEPAVLWNLNFPGDVDRYLENLPPAQNRENPPPAQKPNTDT